MKKNRVRPIQMIIRVCGSRVFDHLRLDDPRARAPPVEYARARRCLCYGPPSSTWFLISSRNDEDVKPISRAREGLYRTANHNLVPRGDSKRSNCPSVDKMLNLIGGDMMIYTVSVGFFFVIN